MTCVTLAAVEGLTINTWPINRRRLWNAGYRMADAFSKPAVVPTICAARSRFSRRTLPPTHRAS